MSSKGKLLVLQGKNRAFLCSMELIFLLSNTKETTDSTQNLFTILIWSVS